MRAKLSSWTISVGAHAAAVALLFFGLPLFQKPIQAEEKFQGIEVLLASAPPQPVVAHVPPPPPPPPEPDPIISKSLEPDLEIAPPPKPKPVVQKQPPKPQPPKQELKPVEAPLQPMADPASQQVAAAPPAPIPSAPRASASQDVKSSYLALISAILEKQKDYPRRAQLRNMQGITYLQFTIDRQGRVIQYRIDRSSGHSILDEATENMIRKAGQFPPIPPELDIAGLDIVMPMQYFLKK
jgi:protein TonB